VIHHEITRGAEHLVLHVERGAERGAAVVGGRLDIEAFERRLALDFAVHRAVERDAARHAQVLEAGLLCELAEQAKHDFFEQRLQRRGDVLVLCRQHVARLASRTEQLFELWGEHVANRGRPGLPRHVHPLVVVNEVREVELETAFGGDTNQLVHRVEIFRLAVRGQSHHLVLVSVFREAEGYWVIAV